MVLGCCVLPSEITAQSTALFDDTKVNRVYIDISISALNDVYDTGGTGQYFSARFIYQDGNIRDTVQNVGLRLRGNTSLTSAKKSFKVSFNAFVSGQKYQSEKKINFNGAHNDPTMIREKLFYDVWNRAGMPERKTAFAMLFINGEYMGLYTAIEEFDKDWLDDTYGENDGNFYKCTYPASLEYINANQQTYKDIASSSASGGRAYDLQTNQTADDYTDLVTLMSKLNQPVTGLFEDSIRKYINVEGYMKALAIDVVTGNWDNYAYNKNNYFLYHNIATNKFEFITYDTDNTFGVDWVGEDWAERAPDTWPKANRPLANKLLSVTNFRYIFHSYLDTLIREIVHPDTIFPYIDQLEALITPFAEADLYRTYDYGYTVADFHDGFTSTVDNHTPYGIKPFLGHRRETLLPLVAAELAHPPTLAATPNPATTAVSIEVPIPLTRRATCILFDSIGTQLNVATHIGTTSIQIALNTLPAGIYFALITDGKNTYRVPITKI